MPSTLLSNTRPSRNSDESGFTLIELLIVIVIIGILAAIAIPIFLNQQRSARDAEVASVAREVAQEIVTLQARAPGAMEFYLYTDEGEGVIEVWDDPYYDEEVQTEFTVSKDVEVMSCEGASFPNYQFYVWHYEAATYNDASSAILYDFAAGGIQPGVHEMPDDC